MFCLEAHMVYLMFMVYAYIYSCFMMLMKKQIVFLNKRGKYWYKLIISCDIDSCSDLYESVHFVPLLWEAISLSCQKRTPLWVRVLSRRTSLCRRDISTWDESSILVLIDILSCTHLLLLRLMKRPPHYWTRAWRIVHIRRNFLSCMVLWLLLDYVDGLVKHYLKYALSHVQMQI